ncbi:MAG: hypothetical protein KR126chlam5_00241 [Candidatus Anoxychlamydiales bacterium]|nr:hypothetical protein [Candidatus Anoxychlamydiales bacterium]
MSSIPAPRPYEPMLCQKRNDSFFVVNNDINNSKVDEEIGEPSLKFIDSKIIRNNKDEKDNFICSLCLESIKDDDLVYLTDCNHAINEKCFLQDVNVRSVNLKSLDCPMCREALKIDKLVSSKKIEDQRKDRIIECTSKIFISFVSCVAISSLIGIATGSLLDSDVIKIASLVSFVSSMCLLVSATIYGILSNPPVQDH